MTFGEHALQCFVISRCRPDRERAETDRAEAPSSVKVTKQRTAASFSSDFATATAILGDKNAPESKISGSDAVNHGIKICGVRKIFSKTISRR